MESCLLARVVLPSCSRYSVVWLEKVGLPSYSRYSRYSIVWLAEAGLPSQPAWDRGSSFSERQRPTSFSPLFPLLIFPPPSLPLLVFPPPPLHPLICNSNSKFYLLSLFLCFKFHGVSCELIFTIVKASFPKTSSLSHIAPSIVLLVCQILWQAHPVYREILSRLNQPSLGQATESPVIMRRN